MTAEERIYLKARVEFTQRMVDRLNAICADAKLLKKSEFASLKEARTERTMYEDILLFDKRELRGSAA
jgi:hypothetical protein